MDTLHWSNLDKNNFSVFIRDLSKNLTNVKHLIEDSFKEESKPTKNFHKQRNKKVVKKKKDIIIEQQTKVRLEKQMKEDLSKLDYIMETINYENPYVSFDARWDIEEGYDFVSFQAFTLENGWVSLEGDYSDLGNGATVQPLGEHGYDGLQLDWINE